MLRVGHIFALLLLGLLSLGGYWWWHAQATPQNIPVIKAPTEPYKKPVETDETKNDTTTHSTVHAVIGGDAAHDPSLQNVPPPPTKTDPTLPEDAPAGFSIPKESN